MRKNKSLLIKAFSILAEDKGLVETRKSIRAMLAVRDDLNAREKNALYRKFVGLYQIGDISYWSETRVIEETMKLVNQIERRSTSRAKEQLIKDTLATNRDQALPGVFYLCSYHEKPGKDHKEYQGKMYVDRYWRSTMKGHPELHWLEEPIAAYIRNHNVLTVQQVVHGKPYLLTRPYCKHFLIPINTWDVLTSSLSAIKREHPNAVMGVGSVSKAEYARRHGKLIRQIKEQIKTRINS